MNTKCQKFILHLLHVSRHLCRATKPPQGPVCFTKVWTKGVCYLRACTPQAAQTHAKKFHHRTVLSNMIFNENIQDMFYSRKTVFRLQDWRHIFVNPWCKVWHSCVDTWEIWSSASITPANNASQKPFSVFIVLTWQWSSGISLKRIYWVACTYNMVIKTGTQFHRRYFAWVIVTVIIFSRSHSSNHQIGNRVFFLFQMGLHSCTKVCTFTGERASSHSLKALLFID